MRFGRSSPPEAVNRNAESLKRPSWETNTIEEPPDVGYSLFYTNKHYHIENYSIPDLQYRIDPVFDPAAEDYWSEYYKDDEIYDDEKWCDKVNTLKLCEFGGFLIKSNF